MPGKESQFFGPEGVPQREEGKVEMPREVEIPEVKKGPEVKEEKEITLEEKTEAIKYFIESRRGVLFPEREEFLLKLQPKELEKAFGEREFSHIYDNLSVANALREEITKSGLKEEEIRQFAAEKGRLLLPERVRDAIAKLDRSSDVLSSASNISAMLGLEKTEPKSETAEMVRMAGIETLKKSQKINNKELRLNLKSLRKEFSEWQKYATFEREKEEKPIKIEGFEKFDCPQMKEKKIIEKVLEMFPGGSRSVNIERIKYEKRSKKISEEYGFSANSLGRFIGLGANKGEIKLFKVPDIKNETYLQQLSYALPHEWGHALDPRMIDQKDLTPSEQFKMIKEWERIRKEELEFSNYVLRIKNKDKGLENLLKSQEGWAESIAFLLERPFYFRNIAPRRYEFCLTHLRKLFPEFDPMRSSGFGYSYHNLIDELEGEVVGQKKEPLRKSPFEK